MSGAESVNEMKFRSTNKTKIKSKAMAKTRTPIIIRLIGLPFVLGMNLTFHLWITIKHTYLYLRYGGEWVGYSDILNKD